MKNLILKALFFVILCSSSIANAQTRLAPIFGDNMVMQQSTSATVWGWDNANQKVRISTSWNKKDYSTTADKEGKWIVKVHTPNAGGPFSINIKGSKTIVLNNVLIGEVWLCSGQSNMEMPVKGYRNQPVLNSQEAILNSANDNIREFAVKRTYSRAPQSECEGEWLISNPENTGNFSATAYFFGRKLNSILDIPIGLIHSSWGGTDVLAWTDSLTVASFSSINLAEYSEKRQNYPSALFNGMINPLIPYTINGVIWYQGEHNRTQSELYDYAFPGMIKNWRELFQKQDLSFYYVQIAPYRYDGTNQGAYLRESQLKTMLEVPFTGMAVTMDIGDYNYIHPADKETVGTRLAYWALARTYGIKGIAYSGPVYKNLEVINNEAHVYFDYAEDGLSSYGKKINYFQIAGDDKVFYPAEARISGQGRVIVTSEEVSKPVAVRYGWFDFAKGNLFNNAGLPASSFRTDNWK